MIPVPPPVVPVTLLCPTRPSMKANGGQKELARMRANDADCTNVPKAPRLSTSEASGYQANDPIKLEQEPPIDIPFEPAKSPRV